MGEGHQRLFVGKGGEADAASTVYHSRGLIAGRRRPEHSSTCCTPLPPVVCAIASTGSSSVTLTIWSAPRRRPIWSRRSRVPVRITGVAPNDLATPTPISPIGPGRVTTTLSPRNESTHNVEAVHCRTCGDDRGCLFVGSAIPTTSER